MTGPRSGWVLRREFDCDEGTVSRWWMGRQFDGDPNRFSEPEDAVVFPRRIEAEEAYRREFGRLDKTERAQRVEDAFAEVSGGLGVPPGRGAGG